MTKAEFIDKVADKSGLTKRDAAAAVDAFLDSVTEALKGGDAVSFTGFGKFSRTAARRAAGRQPAHGRARADPGGHRAQVLRRQPAQAGAPLALSFSGFESGAARAALGASGTLRRTHVRVSCSGCSSPSTPPTGSWISSRSGAGPVPVQEAARTLFALAHAPEGLRGASWRTWSPATRGSTGAGRASGSRRRRGTICRSRRPASSSSTSRRPGSGRGNRPSARSARCASRGCRPPGRSRPWSTRAFPSRR